jgi:signal peptidase
VAIPPLELRRATSGSGTVPALGGSPRARPARLPRSGISAAAAKLAIYVGGVAVVLAAIAVLVLSVGPRLLPYRTYAIDSGSMAPTLPVGSEVVLRPVAAAKLKVGDIITFKRPDNLKQLVTHRIARIERRGGKRVLVTKGDANAVPDSWRVIASGTGWRYAFRIPYAGYLVQGLTLPVVRLGLFALIALLLAATALKRIWRPSGQRP